MPTISSTPRSAGTSTRSGRISSTPRGVGSSASRGGSLTDPKNLAKGQATKSQIDAAGRKNVGAGPAFTPLGAVLRAANTVGLGIGRAIEDPKSILHYSAVDAYKDPHPTGIGDALEKRGALDAIPDKYGLRTVTKLAADIALDPTTYVSFGGASAVKTAGASASLNLLQKAARHEAIDPTDVAKAARGEEVARAAVPRAFSVGVQLPFTRANRLVLGESTAIPAAISAVGKKLGGEKAGAVGRRLLSENFAPAAGTDKVVYRIGRKVDQFASTQKRQVSREAAAFDKELTSAIKQTGLSRYEGNRIVTMAVEQPEKYGAKVPEPLQPFVDRLRASLDEYDQAENIAGIDKGTVPDYVPHRLLNVMERRRFHREYGGTASLDNPSFIKERTFPNIEAGEAAGFKFEVNPARLLEVRGHASIDARAKKAFDDQIAAERGVMDVPDAPPAGWSDGEMGGVATKTDAPALSSARMGWSEYPSKYLKDVSIDPETRAAVMRVHEQITPIMMSDGGLEKVAHFANTVTARWKALALANPGFHLRNGFSDAMSAFWAGGRNPKSYSDAAQVLLGKAPHFRLTVDGVELDSEGLSNLARALGAIDQGFSGKEVAAGLTETEGSIRRATQRVRAPGTGGFTQGSRRFGDFRENAGRLGTFIERLKAGDTPYEAARVVNEFHLDYGDVGRFVAGARRFWLPFVTYTSKALPLVGRQMVRRPGTFATLDKTMEAANEAGGSPDLSLLAPGARSSFAVPVPEGFEAFLGGKPGQPVLYNPEKVFSFGVLNQLDPTQIKAEPAGLVSPFVRAAYELPTGYRLYYSGQAARRQRAPWAIQQAARIPGVSRALDVGPKRYRYGNQTVQGYSSTADYLLRLFPPFGASSSLVPSAGAPSVVPSLGSWLTGVRLSPYDLQRDYYYARLNKDRR